LIYGGATADDYEAAGEVMGGLLSMGAAGPARNLGSKAGQLVRKEASEVMRGTLGPKLAPVGPPLEEAATSLPMQSKGGAAKPGAAKPLPALDSTGKVHGELPKASELGKYSNEELTQLLTELKQSVKERIRKTVEMGPHKPHGERQAAEQELIRQIEKHLEGRDARP